jgi:Type II secretion system (T2SS), protein M subtype b
MLLARLMNAPLRIQKLIAGGLLLLLGVIAGAVFWFSFEIVSAGGERLTDLREQAGKLTQLAALKNGMQPMDLDATAAANQQLFLEAESLTIGRATLQSNIDTIAQSNNLQLASAGSLPDIDEKGIKLIGLRIDMSGSYEAIQKAIIDIETVKPPLLVRELTLRLTSGEAGDRPVELAAQVKIFGAFRLTGEGSQPAPAEGVVTP